MSPPQQSPNRSALRDGGSKTGRVRYKRSKLGKKTS